MIINELMAKKNISMYRLSKITNIPYTTINEMCNGKTNFRKCPAETVYKIAKALDTTVEELIEAKEEKRVDFELFKSHICHQVKEMSDIPFMIELLETDRIREYETKKWWPECLYLLAMLDYLSRIHDFPLAGKYDDLRKRKLKKPIYPAGILALDFALKDSDIKLKAYHESIPEFKRFNIIESEIRNVI